MISLQFLFIEIIFFLENRTSLNLIFFLRKLLLTCQRKKFHRLILKQDHTEKKSCAIVALCKSEAISKFTASNPLDNHTFLHRINTSGVKISSV